MKIKVTSLDPKYNSAKLKEKIRALIEEHFKPAENVHVTVIYEIHNYKKPNGRK